MIDAGLPDGRDGWPPGVLDNLRRFTQGDVVDASPVFYFADPNAPVWEATRAANLDLPWLRRMFSRWRREPDLVVTDLFPYALITSQTCDIAEEDSDDPVRPFVQLAPVYEAAKLLDGTTRSLLKKGRGPMYLLHLPALPDGFWVADLRIEVPVEKGWLAPQTPRKGFATERDQQIVGVRLARIRDRPAFAGTFVATVHRPLIDALKSLKSADREQWKRIADNVAEVRAAVDSRIEPRAAQLYILSDTRIPGDVQQWFHNWWDEVSPAALATGIELQAIRVLTYDELTAAEYLASGELDLTRFSPN